MTFYIFYYLSIFLLFVIDYVLTNTKVFSYMALMIIVIISGTRYNTGYDFYNYHLFYTHSLPESLEPLFKLSIKFLNIFSTDSQLMFFTYSFVTISFTYFAITKMTKYTRTSMLIFLLIPGLYLNTFSIIRQGIAEAFLLIAIYYLVYKNKKLRFWIFSFIAIGFHYSAIIPFLAIYFLKRLLAMRYTIFIYLTVLTISLLLYQINIASILINLAPLPYSTYALSIEESSLLKIIVLNFFILVLIFFRKQYINSKSDLVILNFSFLGIIFLNIFADFLPVTRLAYYFLFLQIIIVPKFIYSFKDINLKGMVLCIFIPYYLFIFINALQIDAMVISKYKLTPYQNYYVKD